MGLWVECRPGNGHGERGSGGGGRAAIYFGQSCKSAADCRADAHVTTSSMAAGRLLLSDYARGTSHRELLLSSRAAGLR